jgi:hypothetical protein
MKTGLETGELMKISPTYDLGYNMLFIMQVCLLIPEYLLIIRYFHNSASLIQYIGYEHP